jgi:negative regulator of replication initiation
VSQWQELATTLYNRVTNKNLQPQELVDKVAKASGDPLHFVEKLTDRIVEVQPEIEEENIIKAIIWTLFPFRYSKAAISWLSGQSISGSKARQLDLPETSESESHSGSFKFTCQLLNLISDYYALVICFDDLDKTNNNQSGYTTAQVVANLAKDLYNQIKQGVLVTALYENIWKHEVMQLPQSEAIVERVGEYVHSLQYLDGDNIIDLVATHLEKFYKPKGLTPPHKVYPFEESKLRALGREKPTARRVLQWCQKNWLPPNGNGTKDGDNYIEKIFEDTKASIDEDELLEEEGKIANSLHFGFERLYGKTLEDVHIQQVEPTSSREKYLDFKLQGNDRQGKDVVIGVAVLQASNSNSVAAGLSRLANYQKYGLTRGCMVRSKKISETAKKAQNNLHKLLDEKGGEWVNLKLEEILPLVAIREVYKSRQDYELEEQQIFDFIEQKKLAEENDLLLEILSDPSGEIPEDTQDEDAEFEEEVASETFDGTKNTERIASSKLVTGRKIVAFFFQNNRYEANTWKDFLIQLATILQKQHPQDFKKVLSLTGRTRLYFSHDPDFLWMPIQIPETNIYVETNLNASSIVRLGYQLIDQFGYPQEALEIEVANQ